MFKKLFYRRSLKDAILNLSAGAIQYERVTDLIANLNELYLACTYGDHFSKKIEAQKAQIEALDSIKERLQKEIFELEKTLESAQL